MVSVSFRARVRVCIRVRIVRFKVRIMVRDWIRDRARFRVCVRVRNFFYIQGLG